MCLIRNTCLEECNHEMHLLGQPCVPPVPTVSCILCSERVMQGDNGSHMRTTKPAGVQYLEHTAVLAAAVAQNTP